RRGRAWSRPRMVAMWLCSQVATDTTLPRVGAHFARDYSTVVNARREIGRVLKLEPALRSAALATCRALSVEAPDVLEAQPGAAATTRERAGSVPGPASSTIPSCSASPTRPIR